MAWIESHQSLLNHRKTMTAAGELRISRVLLIGHLHALWWWALDNVGPDGDLSGISDAVIEGAACWEKRPGEFAAALKSAGFIKEQKLHDWYDYGGKLQERRLADRERKRVVRRTSSGHPQDVSRTQHNTTVDNTTVEQRTDAAAAAREAVVFKLYEKAFGKSVPNGIVADKLIDAEREYGAKCLAHSLEEAAVNDAKSWRYVESILEAHRAKGCDQPQAVAATAIDGRVTRLHDAFTDGQRVFGPLAREATA